jgi:hypothetical protein
MNARERGLIGNTVQLSENQDGRSLVRYLPKANADSLYTFPILVQPMGSIAPVLLNWDL